MGRHELRQAWRSLRRAPWYALTTAGVIALTMAFGTTIFAIVDGVLFKPLPYPASDRLFSVIENGYPGSGAPTQAHPSQVQLGTWREALADVRFAGYLGVRSITFTLRSGSHAELLTSARVGAGFFELLGVGPMFGGFGPEDFATSARVPAAVVSYEFWQRWFAGEPAAIGRSIVADDGTGIRVVGVLPRDFVPPWGFHADVVTPLLSAPQDRDRWGASILARLPAGWTAEQGAMRLSAVNATLARDWPISTSPNLTIRYRTYPIRDVTLTPIRTVLTGQTLGTSWLVLAVALSLMVLGCLNVSGLAISRVQDRWRDLSLRRALGADSWDLVRLMAIESGIVVAAGALAGMAAAAPLLRTTVRLMTDPGQFLKLPAVDWRVLGFSALAAVACVTLITAAAARTLHRTHARTALADGPTTARRRRWSSWSIVSGQVTLACVMAVGGALVAGSLVRVWQEDPGFDLARTTRIRMNPPDGASAADIENLVAGFRRLPGVVHAGGVAGGIATGIMFLGSDFDAPAGIPLPSPGTSPGAVGVRVQSLRTTNGYLEAAGLAATDGRLPTPAEFASGAPVLVVSETVARGYWPGQRAVGQALVSREGVSGPKRPFVVIGVVPDARYAALDKDPYGAIYYPDTAAARPWVGSVLIQFSSDSPTSPAAAGTWVHSNCLRCVVYGQPETLASLMSNTILPRTFNAWLFASFGVASLIIMGVGILGLMAMTSSRRTKEIGIRLALGATPARVAERLAREQLSAVVAGLVAGGLVSAWAVRFVSSYLYKLPVYDLTAWASAFAALILVAAIGALIPSARASRVDPVRALRSE